MLRHVPITAELAAMVIFDPCEVHSKELDLWANNREETVKRISAHLEAGTGSGLVGMNDDEPLAIFFHWKASDSERRIFFVARQALFNLGPRGVIACKRCLAAAMKDNSDSRFVAANKANHPKMDRWLRVIGFDDNGTDENGARIFVLARR